MIKSLSQKTHKTKYTVLYLQQSSSPYKDKMQQFLHMGKLVQVRHIQFLAQTGKIQANSLKLPIFYLINKALYLKIIMVVG